MKTFNEWSLNEGKVTIKGTTFIVTSLNDRKGLGIQFIPNSKGLGNGTLVNIKMIEEALEKSMPIFAKCLYYESGHEAAGYVFRIDTSALTDELTKSLS